MSRAVTVHLPERVWAAIVELEPSPQHFALAPEVRHKLKTAQRVDSAPPAVFRTVALSWGEAELLVEWLNTVSTRRDTPRECRAAIEIVRESQHLIT
jgi:hypothetical protein